MEIIQCALAVLAIGGVSLVAGIAGALVIGKVNT